MIVSPCGAHRFLAIRRLADDLSIAVGAQEHPQPLPHDRMIVPNQDPNPRFLSPYSVILRPFGKSDEVRPPQGRLSLRAWLRTLPRK